MQRSLAEHSPNNARCSDEARAMTARAVWRTRRSTLLTLYSVELTSFDAALGSGVEECFEDATD